MKVELVFCIFFLLMIMQSIGARLQVRAYRQVVNTLHQKGNVGIGGRRQRLGPSTIVIIACTGDGIIVGAEKMEGMTIFCRFHAVPELYGTSIYALKRDYENMAPTERRRWKAYEQAVDALLERL